MSNGKIILLEPRRLAARNVAQRLAELLNEKPGDTVGYHLKLLIMSATLDNDRLQQMLPEAPVVISEGRSFPVEDYLIGECSNV
ncbi:hypothetical protein AWP78_23980 [Escherichia coli]|nr:hypothetical protein AWP78_23980 [Escherichia coli]